MASIRDVAAKAGVAPSTVSLVLNGRPWVSADIQQAVQQAVRQLRYTPKKKGRPRRETNGQPLIRRKNQIAFIFRGDADLLQHGLYTNVLTGIQSACDKAGTALVINTVGPESRSLDFLASKVDGVIFSGGGPIPQMLDLINRVPAVRTMGAPVAGERWDHVTYDNRMIGGLAAAYLLDRGHKVFGFFAPYVGGPADGAIDPTLPGAGLRVLGEDREIQFARAIRAAGRTLVRNEGHTDWLLDAPLQFAASVRRLMEGPQRPTALFVPTDWTACCLYPVLQSLGLQVGRDVEVIACDNDTWHLNRLHPRPATIDLATIYVGQRSVQTLLDRIAAPDMPKTTLQFEPRLVAGDAIV